MQQLRSVMTPFAFVNFPFAAVMSKRLVREAHDRNDEVLERIYIDRRFTQTLKGATPIAWKNSSSFTPK